MSESQDIKKLVRMRYYDSLPPITILVDDRSKEVTIFQALDLLKEQSKDSLNYPECLDEIIDAMECWERGKEMSRGTYLKDLDFKEIEEKHTGRKFLVADLEFRE